MREFEFVHEIEEAIFQYPEAWGCPRGDGAHGDTMTLTEVSMIELGRGARSDRARIDDGCQGI